MPTIHRITLVIAFTCLAAGAAVLLALPSWAGLLSLFYLLVWLLWIACVLAMPTAGHLRRTIALWVLVDAGLLLAFLGMARYVKAIYPNLGTDGAPVVMLASYGPVVLPLAFILPKSVRLGAPAALGHLLGHIYADYLWAWVVLSCIAAVQSAVLVALVLSVREIRGRRLRSTVCI